MRIQEFDISSYGRLHVIKLNLFYGGDPDVPARENEVFRFFPVDNDNRPDQKFGRRHPLRGNRDLLLYQPISKRGLPINFLNRTPRC